MTATSTPLATAPPSLTPPNTPTRVPTFTVTATATATITQTPTATNTVTRTPTSTLPPGGGTGGPPVLANGSVENGVTTIGVGQQPLGWTLFVPGTGQTMPFAVKGQEGKTVPALMEGPGEYLIKTAA